MPRRPQEAAVKDDIGGRGQDALRSISSPGGRARRSGRRVRVRTRHFRGGRLRRCRHDADERERRDGAHGHAVPVEPRPAPASTPRAAQQHVTRGGCPALLRTDGHPALLRPRLPQRLDLRPADPHHELPVRRRVVVARREPGVGIRLLRHAARNRQGLDALARPPAQHPRAALPRDRHRHRAGGAGRRRRRAGRDVHHGVRQADTPIAVPNRLLGSAAAMADVQPLRALHYDQDVAGPLQDLGAPPYDVIDPAQREELAGRSPHNVVRIDLPVGEDPYATAAATLEQWRGEGAVVRDEEALWALTQDYTGPDGARRTRHGLLARVRIEEDGPRRTRPHERTHPGPKEDRLNLTRATRANLSPIFSLFDDPQNDAWGALDDVTNGEPYGTVTDADGSVNKLWRVDDPETIATVTDTLAEAELLIADGHHRYETARIYADEIGGEGDHRYVLMNLVAMQDEGLTIFPTPRLVRDTTSQTQEALAGALREHFDISELGSLDELPPPSGNGPLTLGYLDAHSKRPFRLTLKDKAIADEVLADMPDPYRRLDTAVLETLLLKGPLGLTDDDIDHQHGLTYSRTDDEARQMVLEGEADLAFFLRPSPVQQVQEIAATGINMPPKSTYFFPKVPTGLLFNPLA